MSFKHNLISLVCVEYSSHSTSLAYRIIPSAGIIMPWLIFKISPTTIWFIGISTILSLLKANTYNNSLLKLYYMTNNLKYIFFSNIQFSVQFKFVLKIIWIFLYSIR